MQVSWRHRKLQLENLLEAADNFWRYWLSAEAEIPRSHTSIIPEKQATEKRQQEPIQTGDSKRQEAGVSRLVPRLLRTERHRWLPWNAGKNLQKWRRIHWWL